MTNVLISAHHWLGLALSLGVIASAQAQTTTPTPIAITSIGSGWNSDTFMLFHGSATINPAGCPSPDTYMVDIARAGYKTNFAISNLAYATGKRVWVTVDHTACIHGRPVIIALKLE